MLRRILNCKSRTEQKRCFFREIEKLVNDSISKHELALIIKNSRNFFVLPKYFKVNKVQKSEISFKKI